MAIKFPVNPIEGYIHTHDTVRKYIYEGGRWRAYSNNYVLSVENVNFATEAYVDDQVEKLDIKKSVTAATTENITLSGLKVIDSVNLVENDTVLVKDQNDAKQNGIFVVKPGSWVRRSDADTSEKVTTGLAVTVEKGSTHHDTTWALITKDVVLGVSALTFTRFGKSVEVDNVTIRKVGEMIYVDPSVTPYDIGFFVSDRPNASSVIARVVAVRSFKLPVGLVGSTVRAAIASSATKGFDIKKNDVFIGSVNFVANVPDASFTFPSAVTFNAGDLLTVHSPDVADASLADIAFTFMGNLQ